LAAAAAAQVTYWNTKRNDSVQQRVFRADENLAVLTSLFPYTQYTVLVLAYNAAGDGPANSTPLVVNTSESGNYVPDVLHAVKTLHSCCN